MIKGYFITGTDTGVGKTLVSTVLLKQLQQEGYSVAGMKPVASGCEMSGHGLQNDDALQLIECSSVQAAYATVNPYAFEPPIAPHLAAEACGATIDKQLIEAEFHKLAELAEGVVVEGVGGWLVPLNQGETMADVAVMLDLPVIMVVGIRLGCLSHSLLTAAAIESSGLPFAGWVANRIDKDCLFAEETIASLQAMLPAPLVADIAWQENARISITPGLSVQVGVNESEARQKLNRRDSRESP